MWLISKSTFTYGSTETFSLPTMAFYSLVITSTSTALPTITPQCSTPPTRTYGDPSNPSRSLARGFTQMMRRETKLLSLQQPGTAW